MKKMMILIMGLLALSVLVVSCAREGAVAGEASGSKRIATSGDLKLAECPRLKSECGFLSGSGPACVWVDRYSTLELDHTPLSQVCATAGLTGYVPVAYELRRDFSIYSESTCGIDYMTQLTSDHQILKSYGATEVNFGEEVGNIDRCQPSNAGSTYTMTNQHYDGALCCRT